MSSSRTPSRKPSRTPSRTPSGTEGKKEEKLWMGGPPPKSGNTFKDGINYLLYKARINAIWAGGNGKSKKSKKSKKSGKKKSVKNESKKNREEEEEECPICLKNIDPDDEKILKRVGNNCGHSFHKECINPWIKTTKGQNGGPVCPVCRTKISEDQWPVEAPVNQEDNEAHMVQEDIDNEAHVNQEDIEASPGEIALQRAETRAQNIVGHVPFMGILVCMNGRPLQKKYLNSDPEFNLGPNSTLENLKTRLLALAPEFAQQSSLFCHANLGRYLNNAISAIGVTQYREPSFQIKNMYFGTPFSCDKISDLNLYIGNSLIDNDNDNNNKLLIDIYKKYQENIFSAIYANPGYTLLTNIYYPHILRWAPTGHDDYGYHETNYFVNPNNPDIPPEFRGSHDNFKSTKHSLAWLVVNIECNTLTRSLGEGKTKRRRMRNKKSARRYR